VEPHDASGAAPAGVTEELQTIWKREAARTAVAAVPNDAVLGLGSGTTAELMLQVLAERVHAGLRVTGVPTSERTGRLAAQLGIPLTRFDDVGALDMSIDGADEVLLPGLDLVKGRGGALLHEKLIAASSRYRVIIVDATKLVAELAIHAPVPVEVVSFGWRHTAARVAALGAQPTRRVLPGTAPGSKPGSDPGAAAANAPGEPVAPPFLTDSGNYILDCAFAPIADPAALAARLKAIIGVVEHGLFVGMTERVYVAGPDGVTVYDSPH
jgi:ribose 5-phosphate isomerase A